MNLLSVTSKAFSSDSQVAEYVAEQLTNEKVFKCKACEMTFKRIYDLRYHIVRSHLKQKAVKCRLCSASFMYHSQRKTHMHSAHSLQKPTSFQCDMCQRQFKRKNTLADHMLDLHIDKKCLHCDLRFTRKKFLFHMNDAHGSPMPTCGVCGLRTILQSSLVRHQRNVHLNEKKKFCAVCSKRFYSESNLKDHMASHAFSKAYECELCTKSFSRKDRYWAHCKRHHARV